MRTRLPNVSAAITRAAFIGTGADGQPLGLLIDSTVPVATTLAGCEALIEDAGYVPTAVFTSTAHRTTMRAAGGAITAAQRASPLPPIRANRHITGNLAIVGAFQQLVIPHWGTIELLTNPYTLDSTNVARWTASMFADVVPLKPEAFAIVDPTYTP